MEWGKVDQLRTPPAAFASTDRHAPPSAIGRRRFVGLAAGTALAGTALGAGLWRPGHARAAGGTGTPVPIPGGSPLLAAAFGTRFHVYGPGPDGVGIDPVDAEPATITDFNGAVGLAYIDGTVTRRNVKTGEVRTLPFIQSDLRFMDGTFRGTDGQMHQGAFAFI